MHWSVQSQLACWWAAAMRVAARRRQGVLLRSSPWCSRHHCRASPSLAPASPRSGRRPGTMRACSCCDATQAVGRPCWGTSGRGSPVTSFDPTWLRTRSSSASTASARWPVDHQKLPHPAGVLRARSPAQGPRTSRLRLSDARDLSRPYDRVGGATRHRHFNRTSVTASECCAGSRTRPAPARTAALSPGPSRVFCVRSGKCPPGRCTARRAVPTA